MPGDVTTLLLPSFLRSTCFFFWMLLQDAAEALDISVDGGPVAALPCATVHDLDKSGAVIQSMIGFRRSLVTTLNSRNEEQAA
ncbi:hypothetical protein DFH94DRAFT_773098 [Russula ochroleuca]|uniref:Secreted protein n=1 Tax=Russula ochroleuca TaxID=152965 RepID=A0A9P5JXE4_9AGAM|nr:hypothetical protein DFH94DRAFT_773098 [Russula ochroleuca]